MIGRCSQMKGDCCSRLLIQMLCKCSISKCRMTEQPWQWSTLKETFQNFLSQNDMLSEQFSWPIMYQMVCALAFIHDQNIVHSDIKIHFYKSGQFWVDVTRRSIISKFKFWLDRFLWRGIQGIWNKTSCGNVHWVKMILHHTKIRKFSDCEGQEVNCITSLADLSRVPRICPKICHLVCDVTVSFSATSWLETVQSFLGRTTTSSLILLSLWSAWWGLIRRCSQMKGDCYSKHLTALTRPHHCE